MKEVEETGNISDEVHCKILEAFPSSMTITANVYYALMMFSKASSAASSPAAVPKTPRGKRNRSQTNNDIAPGDGGDELKDLTREYVVPPGGESLVDLLEEGIVSLIRHSKEDNNWAPFLFLVQSMGYGKTRAMLELAEKKRRIVYLPCKNIPSYLDGSEGWTVPASLQEMLQLLEHQEDENICDIKWIKFLTALQKTAGAYNSPRELYRAQVSDDGKLSSSFYEGSTLYPSPFKKASSPAPKSAIRNAKKRKTNHVSIEDKENHKIDICYTNATPIDDNSLVVCVDEATALPDPSFRAFRRAATCLGIIIIFSDTTASISRTMPANDASSSWLGGELGHFTAPMYIIPNFDLEWRFDREAQDIENLFRAGRPRWASLLQAIQKKNTTTETPEHTLQTLVSRVQTILTTPEKYAMSR